MNNAPERIWLDPDGFTDGWTSFPDQVIPGDVAYIRADLHEAEVANLWAENRMAEMFGDHQSVVRGIIAAAGELPCLNDGHFSDGFRSGIEEVAARADIASGDGGTQMFDLAFQIICLITGEYCLIEKPPAEVAEILSRAERAEAEVTRLRAEFADAMKTDSGEIFDYHLRAIRAEDELAALRKAADALAEAMAPFAKAGELFHGEPGTVEFDQCIYAPAAGMEYNLCGDDLRRARSALAAYRATKEGRE